MQKLVILAQIPQLQYRILIRALRNIKNDITLHNRLSSDLVSDFLGINSDIIINCQCRDHQVLHGRALTLRMAEEQPVLFQDTGGVLLPVCCTCTLQSKNVHLGRFG